MKIELMTTSEIIENLLVAQGIVWGAILLSPGNTFANPSRVDFMSKYAPDTAWGIIMLLACLPFFFVNKYRYTVYRKFVHIFLWTFWLGIAFIAGYRSSINGLNATDFLIIIPFLVTALLHGIIYAGLERQT